MHNIADQTIWVAGLSNRLKTATQKVKGIVLSLHPRPNSGFFSQVLLFFFKNDTEKQNVYFI